jgi:hypothetical protein
MTFEAASTSPGLQIIHVLVAVAAVIGALVTILAFIALASRGLRRAWASTIGKNAGLYRLLGRLAPNVQADYFASLLGPAVFRNKIDDDHDEHVFVRPEFYVQAVADSHGQVIMYTVTTRQRRFSPPVWGRTIYWSEELNSSGFRLGRFAFSELPMARTPQGVIGWLGARRFHYAEAHYFGNPGLYQTYYLGINDAAGFPEGLENFDAVLDGYEIRLGSFTREGQGPGPGTNAFFARPEVQAFRSSVRPNTYGVTAPHVTWPFTGNAYGTLGPNQDQVRTLADS